MSASFELEAFERLVATPGTILLRVAGRWRASSHVELGEPALRVGDRLVAPLPGPTPPVAGPDAPHWGAAYAVPAALLGEPAFALEVGTQLVPLPAPVERAAPAPSPSPSLAAIQERAAEVAEMARSALRETGPLRDRVAELEERLAERDEELDELRSRCDDAEAAAAAEAAARRRAGEELDGLAERLDAAEAERERLESALREAEEAPVGRLREVAPASAPPPAPEEARGEPERDRERTFVVALFVIALVAGATLIALELTHVLNLTGSL
jgi:hypothetical protein